MGLKRIAYEDLKGQRSLEAQPSRINLHYIPEALPLSPTHADQIVVPTLFNALEARGVE